MSTYRERRAGRAERLRGWADSRDEKAEAAEQAARRTADMIPLGQPVLVGHYSERGDRNRRARMTANFDRAHEHATKATEFRRRADGIEAQAAAAIYDDDPDAIDRLAEKIARLHAERDRIKAYNASCRKGARDLGLLDDAQRADLESIARYAAYQLGANGEFPKYALSNLGANIRRLEKRRDALAGEGDHAG